MKYSILTLLSLSLSASALADAANLGISAHYAENIRVVASNDTDKKIGAEAQPVSLKDVNQQADIQIIDVGTGQAVNPTTPTPAQTSTTAPATVAQAQAQGQTQSSRDAVTTEKNKGNDKKGNDKKGNDKKGNESDFAQTCIALLNEYELAKNSGPEGATQVTQIQKNPNFKSCETAQKLSQGVNNQNIMAKGAFQTSDGAATCVQVAGYTLDYQSCKSTAQVYNTVVVAAMALEMQAEARAVNAQNEIAAKAQQKALAGDVQGAGLQASKENSSTMKQIHTERAAAYGAAVAALGAKVASWVGDAKSACKKVQLENCEKSIGEVQQNVPEEVFANESAKSFFVQALTKYTAELVKAGIEANKYKSSEEAVAKIQNQYEEDFQNNVQLDPCMINPTAKECLTPGTRVAGESFSAGTGSFSIGDAGSNSFDLGSEQEAFGEFGDDTNIESQQVAAITSPFKDDVKEANDILDQAGAASAGGGGSAPGGGGGGGGGMGGGGSASLGNDTKTPTDTPEEAEIKAKKASAGYASGGATGFTGVKSSGEESNPFASLFDQKGSAGGLEEDRSIASNDIDDKSSVLFQKISKKYSEMHSSKRIQANNLELE